MEKKYEQIEKLWEQVEKWLITQEEFEKEKTKILWWNSSNEDTYSYKWWLNSDSFIKRAFAVVWYNFIWTLIFYLIVLIIVLVVVGIIWLFLNIK